MINLYFQQTKSIFIFYSYKLNIIAFKQKVEASITHFQKFSEKFELTEEKENNAANELTDNHQLWSISLLSL